MTISLCMIVKDEQAVLERCLQSVRDVVDEIIIVDTGSADDTEKIARRYTDRVYSFPWCQDFSAARNFSFSKATREYCMWMDADDVLAPKDREALKRLKALLPREVDVLMMRYHVAFDKQGEPTFSYYRERIVRNAPAYRWSGRVHEAIVPVGNVVYSEIAVAHRKLKESAPGRNIGIYEAQKAEGEPFSPRDQFYYGRELYYNDRYEEAIATFQRFLDDGNGWVENEIEACRMLALCYGKTVGHQAARAALLRSFEYDAPRAEVCCDIGSHFMAEGRYAQAIFWYEQALATERKDTTGAFVLPECYGYLPCIQLCVCYDKMGQKEKARAYNERAGEYQPDSEAYLYNKAYYEKLFQN